MKVSRIEKSKHKQERVLVHTEEGDLLRVTEHELLSFGIYVGRELTEEEVASIQESGQKSEIRGKAARLASGRMMSRKELQDHLTRKGVSLEEAADTVAWLNDLGAVNDAAYAGTIVRHYSAMGYGLGRVEQELYRRGVPKNLWEEALTQMPDPISSIETFLQKKIGNKPMDRDKIRKLSAALLRRGYNWSEIHTAMQKFGYGVEDNL